MMPFTAARSVKTKERYLSQRGQEVGEIHHLDGVEKLGRTIAWTFLKPGLHGRIKICIKILLGVYQKGMSEFRLTEKRSKKPGTAHHHHPPAARHGGGIFITRSSFYTINPLFITDGTPLVRVTVMP